jgi:hypothetical protein
MISHFFSKLRNPDEEFRDSLKSISILFPYWMGLLFIIFLLISVFFYIVLGNESLMTKASTWLLKTLVPLILFLILVPYVALKILYFYVNMKLKSKHSTDTTQ